MNYVGAYDLVHLKRTGNKKKSTSRKAPPLLLMLVFKDAENCSGRHCQRE